jgi:uncharacterized damage-inducible protein DinB
LLDYDPVGSLEFFRERHRMESAITARVLHVLPAGDLSYRPHPRSSSAGATAWTIVRGLGVSRQLLEHANAAVSNESHPTLDTLLAEFHISSEAIADRLRSFPPQEWRQERTVTSNGAVILRQPLGQILWLFHVDAIHHRGQLSTYLRPLGAQVPSIYGPSGDEGPTQSDDAIRYERSNQ